MNTYPLFYDFSLNRADSYDFQLNGLIEYNSEVEQICRRIEELSKHKPHVRSKAKPFFATVDTSYDGRSGELGAELIQKIISGAPIENGVWRRISEVQLEAYELAESS